MELVRYIHLNLIRAGVVESMAELNRSPWSGHSALMRYIKRDWQDTGYVLSFFGKKGSGKRRYLEFVKKGIDLSSLAKKVCDVDGVSIGELRSGSRRREIVNARGVHTLKGVPGEWRLFAAEA